MCLVTVLGAGQMGTATASHLARAGHRVRLWGTELDDDIIRELRSSCTHPVLKCAVPSNLEFFQADELENALVQVELVVTAVVSHAVGAVVARAAPLLPGTVTIVNVAKGIPDPPHLTLVDVIEDVIGDSSGAGPAVVGMGGPARASELVRAVPTAVIFGAEDEAAARRCSELFGSDRLRAEFTGDMTGVELCAAMKNGYAIAVGICPPHSSEQDNTRAALITRAVQEMILLTTLCGGSRDTVCGLAGVGDLYVTVQGGRNGAFGALLGTGLSVADAFERMEGQTVEGYAAVAGMYRLVCKLTQTRRLDLARRLPLFSLLHQVLYEDRLGSELIAAYWQS